MFLCVDSVKPPLSRPYTGPFRVVAFDKTGKTVTIRVKDGDQVVSVDRIKPAFIDQDILDARQLTISGRRINRPDYYVS